MKDLTTIKSISSVYVFIVALVVFISPIVRLVFSLEFYIVIVFAMVLIVFIELIKSGGKLKVHRYMVPLLISLFFLFLFAIFYKSSELNLVFYIFVSLIMFFISSWLVGQDKLIVKNAAFLALLLFFLFFVISGYKLGFQADNINYFLINSSRNIVSATAIFLQILYSSLYYRVCGRLPIITPVITFILCFLSFGRTGLVLSFLILLFTFFTFFNYKNSKKIVLGFCVFCLILCIIIISNYEWFYHFIVESTNFKSGVDTPRNQMLIDYFNYIDYYYFILGVDLNDIPSIMFYSGNPHNSYVFGHANYGVFYLLYIFNVFSLVFFSGFFYKRVSIYLVLLFVFLSRLFFDLISLFGLFDFILYLILFVLLEKRNS